MQNIPEIKFEEISGRQGNLGVITLNRPQVLNALNHAMFIAINNQLTEWENADHIKAVVVRAAEGRAFCAGGDIRYAYERKLAKDPNLVDFFRDEYLMNKHIHHYTKPYIALLDGITMGGGAGISIHGSHRVATERLVFAMPETGIGFFPDVGMTWYLSRMPYKIGFYLGLTGVRISSHDCLMLNLVDEIVDKDCFPELIYAIADLAAENDLRDKITAVIRQFSMPVGESALFLHRDEIANCFSRDNVEDILDALTTYPTQWCSDTAALLKTKSPSSLKVTFRALEEAAKMEFDDCIEMEYRLTTRFMQGHDFFEGVRAVLIDKDQSPHWRPAALKDVTVQDVTSYFMPLEKELV